MCTVECFVFMKVSFTHSYCESIECRANRADEIYIFGVKLVSNRFALSVRTEAKRLFYVGMLLTETKSLFILCSLF